MSKTVRYKLSGEEHRIVLAAANQMGISVEALALQSLRYVLQRAYELGRAHSERSELGTTNEVRGEHREQGQNQVTETDTEDTRAESPLESGTDSTPVER